MNLSHHHARHRAAAVTAVLLVVALPVAAVADQHEMTLKQQVEAAGDALTKAMLADDVDAMFAMYAEDAISLPNQGPRLDGLEALKKQHEEMSAAGVDIRFFTRESTEIWEAGDQVVEIGEYRIVLEAPGAPELIHDQGKYLTVWARDADGSLEIKVETWNTDVDPMAASGAPPEEAPAETAAGASAPPAAAPAAATSGCGSGCKKQTPIQSICFPFPPFPTYPLMGVFFSECPDGKSRVLNCCDPGGCHCSG